MQKASKSKTTPELLRPYRGLGVLIAARYLSLKRPRRYKLVESSSRYTFYEKKWVVGAQDLAAPWISWPRWRALAVVIKYTSKLQS